LIQIKLFPEITKTGSKAEPVFVPTNVVGKTGRGEPKQQYPAKPESPDKYTSYHLYVSDDLINEIVTIGKESLKGLMPYKT